MTIIRTSRPNQPTARYMYDKPLLYDTAEVLIDSERGERPNKSATRGNSSKQTNQSLKKSVFFSLSLSCVDLLQWPSMTHSYAIKLPYIHLDMARDRIKIGMCAHSRLYIGTFPSVVIVFGMNGPMLVVIYT